MTAPGAAADAVTATVAVTVAVTFAASPRTNTDLFQHGRRPHTTIVFEPSEGAS